MRLSLPVLLVAAALAAAPAGAKTPVDVELVFLVDASGSIDDEEMALQRQGYAAAVTNAEVVRAMTGGYLRSVALAYVEFAASGCTTMRVGWHHVTDRASAESFAAKILAAPREYCSGGNAIGEAVAFSHAQIRGNAFEGTRQVIDVSGDGPNTFYPPVEAARDAAVADGLIINGLAIMIDGRRIRLDEYYRNAIIGGPGSFVMVANGRQTFADAILKKLIREMVAAPPEERHAGRIR